MPELPDLEYIVRTLRPTLQGRQIIKAKVFDPVILRVLLPTPIEDILAGQTIHRLHRHGPFLVFTLDAQLRMVMHLMLAGRLARLADFTKPKIEHCFALDLDDNTTLVYGDSKRMGKIYVLAESALGAIPRFVEQGPDILSPEFSESYFLVKLAKSRKQVRVFLMEQETISAIGNAYADEILFAAGLHPKTLCSQVPIDERSKLYRAIKEIMAWGIREVEAADLPTEEKFRQHLKVRNRYGEPCPNCGTKIRRAGVRGYDAFFCPQCQPPRRTQFIEW